MTVWIGSVLTWDSGWRGLLYRLINERTSVLLENKEVPGLDFHFGGIAGYEEDFRKRPLLFKPTLALSKS